GRAGVLRPQGRGRLTDQRRSACRLRRNWNMSFSRTMHLSAPGSYDKRANANETYADNPECQKHERSPLQTSPEWRSRLYPRSGLLAVTAGPVDFINVLSFTVEASH